MNIVVICSLCNTSLLLVSNNILLSGLDDGWEKEYIPVPVPVPVYVPLPMHMYSQKVPVPTTVPVPVS